MDRNYLNLSQIKKTLASILISIWILLNIQAIWRGLSLPEYISLTKYVYIDTKTALLLYKTMTLSYSDIGYVFYNSGETMILKSF